MNPDSDAGPAGVRVRRLIRVRPSGKVLGPSPTSGTHSSGAAIGPSNRPAKPPKWQAAQASTIGNGLETRAASAGTVSALPRPRAEYSAPTPPPTAGVAPASVRTFGNQVNIKHVASHAIPTTTPMTPPPPT